jgi:hypothetical protein
VTHGVSQIVRDAIKESGQVLPHPSTRLPRDTSMDIRGWPMYYLDVHPGGMVGYHLTQRIAKIISLRDLINHVQAST